MRDLYEGLRALNVADERIRFEAFGPASVKRTPAIPAASRKMPRRAARERTRKRQGWHTRDVRAIATHGSMAAKRRHAAGIRRGMRHRRAVELPLRDVRHLLHSRAERPRRL